MSAPLSRGLRPIHPGELLREDVLPALGRPKTGIAWPLGISRQTLYDILAERAPGYRADGDPLGQTKRQRAGTVVRVAGWRGHRRCGKRRRLPLRRRAEQRKIYGFASRRGLRLVDRLRSTVATANTTSEARTPA
jgi:hypothetical protein